MFKHEFENNTGIRIQEVKLLLEENFPDHDLKDYSENDVWVLKTGLRKHEIKIYPERIFIKSMIDANSSKISFPIMLFFIVSFIINQWILKKQGINLLIPLFVTVLLSFVLIPAFINMYSLRFRENLSKEHDQLLNILSQYTR